MAMKFRAHDTFFIRKGWLSKGMKYVQSKPDVFIAKDENPMDVLGIGANMVKALRYWLQAVGLTTEPNKGKEHKALPHSDRVFMNTIDILRKWELYIFFITNCHRARKRQPLGTTFSMSSICPNLPVMISSVSCSSVFEWKKKQVMWLYAH